MAIKRRDLLEGSRLLAKHGLAKAGELDQAGLMLAVTYIGEKRDGKTDLTFPDWLDGDFEGGELGEDDEDPTVT